MLCWYCIKYYIPIILPLLLIPSWALATVPGWPQCPSAGVCVCVVSMRSPPPPLPANYTTWPLSEGGHSKNYEDIANIDIYIYIYYI